MPLGGARIARFLCLTAHDTSGWNVETVCDTVLSLPPHGPAHRERGARAAGTASPLAACCPVGWWRCERQKTVKRKSEIQLKNSNIKKKNSDCVNGFDYILECNQDTTRIHSAECHEGQGE